MPLALGATDYFTKPTSAGGLEASLQVLREQLIPEIKALCALKKSDKPQVQKAVVSAARPFAAKGVPQVLAIGTSTGGPNALAEIFAKLPADFPVPIVLVQHMPPMFTRLLAERLSAQSKIRVQEGCSGAILQPGQAWIAPGDFHMITVRDGTQVRLLVHQDPFRAGEVLSDRGVLQ